MSRNIEKIPLDCLVCGFMMRDIRDVVAHEDFKCCHECAMEWAEPRRKEWNLGWRPTKGEILKNRKKRLSIPTFLLS